MPRGDVVLIALPRPIVEAGHEQFGDRPAIVIQDDHASANLSTIVVVPLTGELAATRFHGSFVIKASRANGLDRQSVVLTQQVLAIDKRRLGRKIGKLAPADLKTLEDNLRQLLGL